MPSFPAPRLLSAAAAILAAASGLHCAPTILGGGGGGQTSSAAATTTGSSSTTTVPPGTTTVWTTATASGTGGGPTTSSGGPWPCTVVAPSIVVPALSTADAQGLWSDPATGLSGQLFLDPPAAGSFSSSPNGGTEVKYTQQQQGPGDFSGDPSFGVWFSHCVDASSSLGILFSGGSAIGEPPTSNITLVVQTVSNTPAPHGTCAPAAPGDCLPASFPGNAGPQTIGWDWDQLSGGSPAQTGAEVAQEVVGVRWYFDAWEGPPPQVLSIDYFVTELMFFH